jgi:hypothetical protein
MLVLLCVFGFLRLRAARAEVQDRTLELGRQMLTLANAAEHDVNKVTVNGQRLWIGNSLSHDTAKTVLDRYEAHCADKAAQTAESWRELAQKESSTSTKKWGPSGVMRSGTELEGTVVCFTKTAASKPSILESAKVFAETGNLGAVGAARYVYARTTERGNTHVLTAWTDDTFNLFELIGTPAKDVPGADFGFEIPRVRRGTRVLSALLDETGFGLNVYQSDETDPLAIARFYDAELQTRGWAAVDPELERRESNEGSTPREGRVYEKDNVVLTLAAVRASNDPRDGMMTVLGLAGLPSEQVGAGQRPPRIQRQEATE